MTLFTSSFCGGMSTGSESHLEVLSLALVLEGWHSAAGGSPNTVSLSPGSPRGELRTGRYLAVASP